MITIFDLRGFDCASLPTTLQPQLRALIADTERTGLTGLTVVLIVEAGDTEDDIIREIGWSPLCDPIEGMRYNQPGFEPYWVSLSHQDGWYWLTHVVADDGFAYILFIDASDNGELQAMCRDNVA